VIYYKENMRKRKKSKTPKLYVIGVDAGGTKTDVALADLSGKILTITRSGPANPRNLGIEESELKRFLKKHKIK
jgi:N-acetylglucosamine kinase-like BadF-type ATPase